MIENNNTQFLTLQDEDQDLWLLMSHTRYAMFRSREKELQRYGISPEQVILLFHVLTLKNQATPASLARYLLRQPHTISALVDRMARKGLIKKIKDLDRKNMVRVVITEKGQKAFEKSKNRGSIHRIVGELSPEEKKRFCQYLERIYAQARKEIGLDADSLPSSEE
jgi:MarR family transcriptional regulator, organic hydroperoxide resistance regulator